MAVQDKQELFTAEGPVSVGEAEAAVKLRVVPDSLSQIEGYGAVSFG